LIYNLNIKGFGGQKMRIKKDEIVMTVTHEGVSYYVEGWLVTELQSRDCPESQEMFLNVVEPDCDDMDGLENAISNEFHRGLIL